MKGFQPFIQTKAQFILLNNVESLAISNQTVLSLCRDAPRGEAGGAAATPDFGRSGQGRRAALLLAPPDF